jgi:hypothetical protein
MYIYYVWYILHILYFFVISHKVSKIIFYLYIFSPKIIYKTNHYFLILVFYWKLWIVVSLEKSLFLRILKLRMVCWGWNEIYIWVLLIFFWTDNCKYIYLIPLILKLLDFGNLDFVEPIPNKNNLFYTKIKKNIKKRNNLKQKKKKIGFLIKLFKYIKWIVWIKKIL